MATHSIIMRNTVFIWIALATCLALMIPLSAMQFTASVRWGVMDFVVMAAILFGISSLFVLVARKVPRKYWLAMGAAFAAVFLHVWAELAVGIFTSLGS